MSLLSLANVSHAFGNHEVLGAPVSISVAQQIVGPRYRLEHVAVSGSMGRVLVATDAVLQRCVARAHQQQNAPFSQVRRRRNRLLSRPATPSRAAAAGPGIGASNWVIVRIPGPKTPLAV